MRALKQTVGCSVVVATPATTVRGSVVSVSRQFVSLTGAESLDRPEPVAIVGTVLVPVSQISYVQVVK